MATVFWVLGVLYTDFLIDRRTINAPYNSLLFSEKMKPAFYSKRRKRSLRGVIILHDNARPHTAELTQEIVDRLH